MCLSRVVCLRHAQGRAMVPPWCGQGFSWWLPSLSHIPPLKEQYMPFSLFLEETSTYLRRHNGIINNYKLKFQKSLSLHLHHLIQVRAQCPSGAHAVHVWLTRGACLARPRCVSGSPTVPVWLTRGARLDRLRCAFGSPAVHV